MMKQGTNLIKLWCVIAALALLPLVMAGCALDTRHMHEYVFSNPSWKEEVALQNGQKLIIERSHTYGRKGEIGQGRIIEQRTLDFIIPDTQQKVHWEGEEHVIPMLLDFKEGVPYLAAKPFSCLSFEKVGRPIPPYVLYKYTGTWARITIEDFPPEFSQANLLVDTYNIERIKSEQPYIEAGYVSAEAVKKNAPSERYYHAVLRTGAGPYAICPAPGVLVIK